MLKGSGGAAAAGPKGGSKKSATTTSGSGASVQLEADWIAEHVRQVSRMMPGGLEVLGLYLLAPDAAWSSAAGQLCGALATIAADFEAASGGSDGADRALLLLHVDSNSRKMTMRSCACNPAPAPSGLKIAELRNGTAASSLVRLTTHVTIDAAVPALSSSSSSSKRSNKSKQGEVQLQDLAEALVAAEAARIEGSIAALESGVVLADAAVIGDVLPPDAGLDAATPVQLLCAPPAVAAASSGGSKEAASTSQLNGRSRLRGEVVGVAYVHRREAAGRALADLKADVVKSLRARLDLLVEEALAAAEEHEEDEKQQERPSSSSSSKPAHPLLAAAAAGGGATTTLALPRRVLMPWTVAGASLRVCDYLAEGEGRDAAAARAQELLGTADVSAAQVEELEAAAGATAAAAKRGLPPPSKAKGTAVVAAGGGGGNAPECSNSMVAGLAAGAAAAVAMALGYLSMGSSS